MSDVIYEMNLHDEIQLDRTLSVIKVAGGWIYRYDTECGAGGWNTSMVFVPFNTEYVEWLQE